jgi:hypothetical protein
MTLALVILAAVVAAGGVTAVSAREPRFAALGTVVALVGSAYVADPVPSILALAVRLVGAVLAGYLLWVALRRAPAPTSGWRLGWPGATAIAIVAFAAGWLAADSLGAALATSGSAAGGAAGSVEGGTAAVAPALAAGSLVGRAAIAAAFALVALLAAPVLVTRDVLRMGLGLLLLVAAAGLLLAGLTAGIDPAIELGLAVLTAAGGAAVAIVSSASLRVHGDLAIREPGGREAPVRRRIGDEAHEQRLGAGDRR